jgi:molybdopterin/thiamine biosynthesis adenylyltransferase
MSQMFDYELAFSRNIGWVTRAEQSFLRGKRIAIAGMGGVGGSHLLTLARLGIGAFTVADFDSFELGNFNRQAGANMDTVGRPKVEVLAEMAEKINPELDLRIFREPIGAENVDAFLQDVDVYIDGLDYFVFEARRVVYEACYQRNIPAVMAGPIGISTALLTFMPGGMTLDEYFGFAGQSEEEMAIRFLIGLTPSLLHRNYLADPSAVNFAEKRGPSTPMACELCAATAATEAMKILLERGKVRAAPRGLQFDAYRNKLAKTWRPWGHRNPLQQLAFAFGRRELRKVKR